MRIAFSIAAALGVLACHQPPREPPESVSDALEPLYAAVRDYRDDYEQGLALIVSGDAIAGRNLLTSASDRLSVSAELCARMPECDARLFAEAMEQVLLEREAARGAEQPDELEVSSASEIPSILSGVDLRASIELNESMRAALNDWLTRNRPILTEAYENYQFLRPKIWPIYEEAQLPEALLFAMMARESGGRVHAYSRAGAAGPLQFMRRTGRRYGLGTEEGFDLRLDPVAATRASARYLNDQLRLLSGDLAKALAAYNGGESRLLRLHRKHDGADFWDPRILYSVPRETQDYVPSVLAAALIFLDPAEYGVHFAPLENTISQVVLAGDASLGELAICLGGSFRTLRNLNPRLEPEEELPAGTPVDMPSMLVPVYAERCREDSALRRLGRELHAAANPPLPELIEYTVRRGDTLTAIATRFDCESSVGALAAMNRLRPPGYEVRIGQRLQIPRCG
jgi:membrane-bound lytic murein transglycosylase D